MKLDVIAEKDPWYADGLNFTCTQCGNCCTGGPGYVWISTEEITRLAAALQLSPAEVVERYCRKVSGQFSLKERRGPGGYDCIFLKEEPATRPVSPGSDEMVTYTRRICTVYNTRPLQCRTWPFWPEILATPKSWEQASRRCPGMGVGDRHFPLDRIGEIRDAKDWPSAPPSSAAKR